MQPSDRSGFFPSGQEPVDGQAARLEALGSQVAQAQAELEEYQRLLNELPGIYEGKFRQKLRSVAQEIRQLLNERKALQQQLGQALAETRQPKLLSASDAASEFPDHRKDQNLDQVANSPLQAPAQAPADWYLYRHRVGARWRSTRDPQPYQQPFSFSPGWDVASFPSGTSSAKSSYHDSVAGSRW